MHLSHYLLQLADDALILGHRNSEWTGHGPVLEQDIALSNISLDLIGQARNFYQYAADLLGEGITEDSLAYLRSEDEFKNCLLVEQDNGHWGKTILRQFFFSAYAYPLYERLILSKEDRVAAIAAKSIKETTYHLRWSSEWVIRLGKGTSESHERMEEAMHDLWKFTDELKQPADYERSYLSPDDREYIRSAWNGRVNEVLRTADLQIRMNVEMLQGGKQGKHTPHLGQLLNEMQFLQREHPGAQW